MTILVTGGAGYLGSTLVPLLLERGHRVRVYDVLLHGGAPLLGAWSHPGFEFRRGDIRDRAGVRDALSGAQAVVHLAAIVGDPACAREPELAKAVNLEASLSLLEESRRAGVRRFVFASTCSNYGKMEDPEQYVDESAALKPVSLYAETKVAVEAAVLDPARTDAMCATALRFATVFGVSPRMRFDLTVNEFVLRLAVERRLQVYGEQFWRPYVHVRDASRAVVKVLEAPEGKVAGAVFNVGSTDQNFTKKQIVGMVLPYVPGAEVEFVRKAEDPRDYRVSFSKIRDTLQFRITRSVSDGIREVYELIRNGILRDLDSPAYKN